MKKLLLVLILALFLPVLALAVTRNFACTEDAYITNVTPTSNFGADTFLWVGYEEEIEPTITRAVLAFSQPGNVFWSSDSAKIKIRGTTEYTTTDYYVYIYTLSKPFTESEVSWDTAQSELAWTTPGGDYNSSPKDSFLFTAPHTTYTVKLSEAMSDTIEACIKEGRIIYLELINKDEASVPYSHKTFSSSEGGQPCSLFVYGSFELPPPLQGWYNPNWAYRVKISVDSTKVAATHADFPVYVNLDPLGTDFWNNVKSDGSDLLVTASDGTTKLNRELQSFSVGSTVGELHFRAPNLPGDVATDFYLYFGYASAAEVNDTTTWNQDYIGIWHKYKSGSVFPNSAGNSAYDGTPRSATEPTEVTTGKVYNAGDYDGTNDSVNCSDIAEIDGLTAITVEAWAKWEGTANDMGGSKTVSTKQSNYSLGGGWDADPENLARIYMRYSPGTWIHSGDGTTNIADGTFHYLVGKYADLAGTTDTLAIYVDGAKQAGLRSSGRTFAASTYAEVIGATGGDAAFWNGVIDEVRISRIGRSAEWILTTYNNLNSPSTFYAFGSVESAPSAEGKNARRERLIRIGGG